MGGAGTADEVERRVWELLTRSSRWQLPAGLGVTTDHEGPARYQPFEVAVAAVFARLRPEYRWFVTPDRPDGGLDFVGRQRFLHDDLLGIAAAVTVGGQCKMRSRVDDVVEAVAGSLARMVTTTDPTFFVVALSARLDRQRVDAAQDIIRRAHNRHCHILDRTQIEGLMSRNLDVVGAVLEPTMTPEEVALVIDYLTGCEALDDEVGVVVSTPERVLAGVPFGVTVTVRNRSIGRPVRLWWRSEASSDGSPSATFLGPVDADSAGGRAVSPPMRSGDPRDEQVRLDLVSHGAGRRSLGQVLVSGRGRGADTDAGWVDLGTVLVVDHVRPRFYAPPFVAALDELDEALSRSVAGGLATLGVVGAGGSGKSRLCEEFCIEQRRWNASVVSARQAKTLDDPSRILAELFDGLVDGDDVDPAAQVIGAIRTYDGSLAERAAPAIRAIYGARSLSAGPVVDQAVISALLLLLVTHSPDRALIVHLQDLHWCTADVLRILETLVWQLGRVQGDEGRSGTGGILFLLEGRIRERQADSDDGWLSEPFEAFLERLDCGIVRCGAFTPEQGLEFTRRLFEDHHSAHRLVDRALLRLQLDLVESIDRASGGNPFHTLEQVRHLKARRVIGQNPETGLLYQVQPSPVDEELPETVFAAIELRWRDMTVRKPPLALLVWAVALIDDRAPMPLFRSLWRGLAPDVSLADIDGTEILWTGAGGSRGVVFRHENYLRSLRRFEVSAEDRRRVVEIFCEHYANLDQREPADDLRWARALLEHPTPKVSEALPLLARALEGAERSGDVRLARRIAATELDLLWTTELRSALPMPALIDGLDRELGLIRDLMGSDRVRATARLATIRSVLERRGDHVATGAGHPTDLRRRALVADLLRSQLLYNDRQAAVAAQVAADVVAGVAGLRTDEGAARPAEWDDLEMEALHSRAVALALAGEIDLALEIGADAVTMARSRRPPSLVSLRTISSYANILLARDPEASEALLRSCLVELEAIDQAGGVLLSTEVNLSMALVLRASGGPDPIDDAGLAEARRRLADVFARSFQLGRYANASAAALMLGIVSAMDREDDPVAWFAHAVAAAARGHKLETLWRAHFNMSMASRHKAGSATATVVDHARAALQILDESLAPYPVPDETARFELVRLPLAHVVRVLLDVDDPSARRALTRYPALRPEVDEIAMGTTGSLRRRTHEWLRIDDVDYVIY